MTKAYRHKRISNGAVGRSGPWSWGAAFSAVAAAGLLLGSTAWTAANALSEPESGSRDTQAAAAPSVARGQTPLASAGGGAAGGVAAESDEPSDAAEAEAPVTVWREDFAAALQAAGEQGKPVLLRFTASWCTPCRVMEAQVWPQEEVRRTLAERAIPVKIDIDKESQAEVARRYGVRAIPALVLVDARGEELARGGFMNVETLLEFLREA